MAWAQQGHECHCNPIRGFDHVRKAVDKIVMNVEGLYSFLMDDVYYEVVPVPEQQPCSFLQPALWI